MDKVQYKKIVERNIKKDNYVHNYLISFLSGGLIGFICQALYLILNNLFMINSFNAKAYVSLFVIFLASFLTAFGIFDKLISKYRSGLIIPTTGFAHSITSSALDAKKEGIIKGLGSNFFHLAGSVILYSVVVSFLLIIIKVMFFA